MGYHSHVEQSSSLQPVNTSRLLICQTCEGLTGCSQSEESGGHDLGEQADIYNTDKSVNISKPAVGIAQSSRPSRCIYLKLVTIRSETAQRLSRQKDSPTARVVVLCVGGSTKFGGAPLGFGPNGKLPRSIFPGRAPKIEIEAIAVGDQLQIRPQRAWKIAGQP